MALAAAEKLRLPAAAFIHSAPGALMPPGGPFEAQLFAAVNQLREESGLSSLRSLWEAWAPFPAISNSIRARIPLHPERHDLSSIAVQCPNRNQPGRSGQAFGRLRTAVRLCL